jgi:hypothetical protein
MLRYGVQPCQLDGVAHDVGHAQSLQPSVSESGFDSCAITSPLLLIS